MGWACGTYRGQERPIHFLMRKREGKRPLTRPRHSWENNFKMDLQEMGWGCQDLTDLAQDRKE